MRRLAALALFLLLVVSVGAALAGSSARPSTYWPAGVAASLPSNAKPGPDQIVSLSSVSCPSADNCSAVGSYLTNGGALEGLLVSETGGRWAPGIEAVLPANGIGQVSLNSVSCASAGNCSAVGSYYDGSSWEGLLLTETAGAWTTGVEAKLPAAAVVNGQDANLYSVSCASNGNCTAVGDYTDQSGDEALIVTESGGAWGTGIAPALPANAPTADVSAGLGAVSCTSAGNCTAVGGYGDTAGDSPGLLLTETDGTWGTGVEAALPSNASHTPEVAAITSVSCASAGNCAAVGNYNGQTSGHGLLLTETGGVWSTGVEALPSTTYAQSGVIDLNAVSCPRKGSCVAVGDYDGSAGNIRGVLLKGTAGKWSRGVEAALPANADKIPGEQLGGLESVSCASAGNCTAVGDYRKKGDKPVGLFVTETAGRWATGVGGVLKQNAPYAAGLDSVSCSSARHCSAAGGYQQAQGVLFSSSATPPCLVPRVKGKTLTAARRSIDAGHCTVGKIERAASRRVRSGRVISQKPRPGLTLKPGAKVDLVVSTGAGG